MKILIAIPCMDQVAAKFASSLATMTKVGDCVVAMQIGSLIYTSRNNLAQKAMKDEFDFVLWLDSDIVFPPDLLEYMMKVLQENNLDILTGVYHRRVAPFSPVLFKDLEIDGEKKECVWTEFTEGIPQSGLFEVGGCGFGCVLMKTDVFFDVYGKYKQCFDPLNGVGEDLSFCWRARQCGYKIICDPAIRLGHVGYTTITRDYYDAYRRELRNAITN